MAQWIQTYSFTWNDYLMIVRTLRTVFPHCGMIILAGGADTVLLASDQPLVPNEQAVAAMQQLVNQSSAMSGDLRKWFQTTDLRLLLMRHYQGDEASLAEAVESQRGGHINTDLNMRLEFDAPLHLFQKLPEAENAQVKIQKIGNDVWRQQLGQALGIQPDSAEYQVVLAEQAAVQTHFDEALRCYQNALVIDPRQADAYRGAAAVQVQLAIAAARRKDTQGEQKRRQAAVAVYRDLLKFHPEDIEAIRALASQLRALKKDDKAAEAWRQLLERSPADVEALDQIALYHLQRKQYTEAAEMFERMNKLRPTNAVARARLAECYLELKRFEPAIAEFRQALKLQPLRRIDGTEKVKPDMQNVIWANNLAWLLATSSDSKLRNGTEAVTLATAACEAAGYKVEFVDTLAAAYAEVGQFDEAVKYCEQFLDQAQLTRPDLVEDAKSRLKLYQSRQPYRQS